MRNRDTFGCKLKEKLNDYRAHMITLDEMLQFIYSIDPKFEKKVISLQNEQRKKSKSRKRNK